MKPKPFPKWPAVWLAALAVVALGSTACSRKAATSDEDESSSVVAEVSVTQVKRADISQTLSVTGTIAALPNRDVKVSPLVTGRVASMAVAEGDHVKEGQVLAALDDRTYRDQLQQAEAAVEQARANLDNARLNRSRNEDLFKRGITARKDLEDARTQESVSEAAVKQAEGALSLAKLQVTRTEVRSPLTGTVVKRLVSVGEQVDGTGAQPILEVADTSEVELFGNVPALYLAKVRVGQALRIATENFPGKDFMGRVVAVAPAVDPSTNVGMVRIRITNAAGLLRLGMFLSVQIPLETHAQALVVPPQAIYRDPEGQPRVYRVQGDTAEAVPVKLGLESQDGVELLSGVADGQTVILTGGYGLPDHAKVKVKS